MLTCTTINKIWHHHQSCLAPPSIKSGTTINHVCHHHQSCLATPSIMSGTTINHVWYRHQSYMVIWPIGLHFSCWPSPPSQAAAAAGLGSPFSWVSYLSPHHHDMTVSHTHTHTHTHRPPPHPPPHTRHHHPPTPSAVMIAGHNNYNVAQ